MSRQFAFPDTKAKYAADRTCDIEHVKLVVAIDTAARRIAGTVTLHVRNIIAGATTLVLDAVELTINGVMVDGKRVAFRYTGDKLHIPVAARSGRKAATPTHVAIDYHGSPRRGLYFVGPDAEYPDKALQAWTQGQDTDSRYWFPCFDSPNQKATSEVEVTIPSHLFALSNGTLRSDKVRGKKRTMHWRLDVPHSCYLITLAIGDFTATSTTWRDIPVVYYAQRGLEAAAARTLARTPQMLELFSAKFGVAYPYPQYAQVFVSDFIFGGMENTSATTLTDAILIDERAAIDYDTDSLVAHELAHQWFGDLVTCRDWGEGWLNEGFATYAEYIWREHHEGRDAADVELDEWAEMYFGEDAGRYRRTVATKMYDEPIDIFDHHLYEKGGRILHMLRHLVGDSAFFGALAHYLEKHKFSSVESRDLARAFDDSTGRVLDWFFDQWVLRGAGHPELAIDIQWDGEQLTIAVAQTQTIDDITPLFRLPTMLRVHRGKIVTDVPIEITSAKQTFYVPLKGAPSQVVFDPGGVLLAKITCNKPLHLWHEQLAHGHLGFDRIAAARELGSHFDEASMAALTAALRSDSWWAVRDAAAQAIAKRQSMPALSTLQNALAKEKHSRARRAIARALGSFVGVEAAADILVKLIEQGDKSYFVEAEACLSLGKTRSPQAVAVLQNAMKRPSFTDVIRQHALRGLAEARSDESLTVIQAASVRGFRSESRRAAIAALAMLCKGRHDQVAVRIRQHIEDLLRDPDFRVQAAALEALYKMADPSALPSIHAMMDRELDGRLIRRGREIVRSVGDGGGTSGELHRLRDDVESLRTSTALLREQVEALRSVKPRRK
jgi:aminopeptidase N